MELSLAITSSLAALSKSLIFCTEPYRMTFAGKVDVSTTGTIDISRAVKICCRYFALIKPGR